MEGELLGAPNPRLRKHPGPALLSVVSIERMGHFSWDNLKNIQPFWSTNQH